MSEEETVEKKRRKRAAPQAVDDPFAAEWVIPDFSENAEQAVSAGIEGPEPGQAEPIDPVTAFSQDAHITSEYSVDDYPFDRPLDVSELEQALNVASFENSWANDENTVAESFVPSPFEPEDPDTNSRRFGLAFSAGIVFFSSIAFMLVIGWIADLLLGSTPWGLVGGIVLGSIIGFVQFFSISSRIFKNSDTSNSVRPLLSHNDDDPPSIGSH